jgi:ethanolamine utilization cobalamin adenosyltransferase
MKRPQFGLRLMLLVVALFASIFAWRRAVETKQHAERDAKVMSLQGKLDVLQKTRLVYLNGLLEQKLSQSFWVDIDPPSPFDSKIYDVQQELKALNPN